MAIFSILQKSKSKTSKTMSDEHFVVSIPKIAMIIEIICDLMFVGIILGFTCFYKELPHIIFYIVFGLFLWFGTYLVLKTLKYGCKRRLARINLSLLK